MILVTDPSQATLSAMQSRSAKSLGERQEQCAHECDISTPVRGFRRATIGCAVARPCRKHLHLVSEKSGRPTGILGFPGWRVFCNVHFKTAYEMGFAAGSPVSGLALASRDKSLTRPPTWF